MVDHIQAYLDHCQYHRRLSDHTVSNYRRDLKLLQTFCDTYTLILLELNSKDIRRFLGGQHQRGLNPRSLRRILSAIKGFFEYCCTEKIIELNPTTGISAPKPAKLLPKTFDVDEVQHLLDQNSDDPLVLRDLAMIELFYSSGLRLSELTMLDTINLDLQEGMVRVLGKGQKERLVPVGKLACNRLNKWLKLRDHWLKQDESAVFISQQGKRLTQRAIQKRLAQLGIKTGLNSRLHPHRLRHSFASHLLESSGHLRAVQSLLGHENISTTQIYTALDFQHLAQVYDAAHPRAKDKKS